MSNVNVRRVLFDKTSSDLTELRVPAWILVCWTVRCWCFDVLLFWCVGVVVFFYVFFFDVLVFWCVQMSRVTVALTQHKTKATKVSTEKAAEANVAIVQANKARKKAWKKMKKERRRAGEWQDMVHVLSEDGLILSLLQWMIKTGEFIFDLHLTKIKRFALIFNCCSIVLGSYRKKNDWNFTSYILYWK